MSVALSADDCRAVIDALRQTFPDARPELNFSNAFELLIATILSAQTTDLRVNRVTAHLFPAYPTPQALAKADLSSLEKTIREIGMYRTKAKNIRATARMLVEQFGGKVPQTMEELVQLPGVGRKTANVVLSNAFGVPAIAVDTHVFRVSNRIGLSQSDNVADCERDLHAAIDRSLWSLSHHLLIFQGRRICKAQRPQCEICPVRRWCRALALSGRTFL